MIKTGKKGLLQPHLNVLSRASLKARIPVTNVFDTFSIRKFYQLFNRKIGSCESVEN